MQCTCVLNAGRQSRVHLTLIHDATQPDDANRPVLQASQANYSFSRFTNLAPPANAIPVPCLSVRIPIFLAPMPPTAADSSAGDAKLLMRLRKYINSPELQKQVSLPILPPLSKAARSQVSITTPNCSPAPSSLHFLTFFHSSTTRINISKPGSTLLRLLPPPSTEN